LLESHVPTNQDPQVDALAHRRVRAQGVGRQAQPLGGFGGFGLLARPVLNLGLLQSRGGPVCHPDPFLE